MKRIAYVLMTWDVILEMAGNRPATTSTLPSDAVVSHIVLLDQSRQARVYFESKSLPEIAEGALIPEYGVVLTSHYPEIAA